MARRLVLGGTSSLLLSLLLLGCSGAASPQPAASSPAEAPASVAAPTVAAPSEAAPSVAEPSAAEASLAIPSFLLPSNAKDLEALLPDKLCGQTAIKASDTGDHFVAQAENKEFANVLQAIGKSPSDVAYAIAVSQGDCLAGIFRIKGADTNTLQSAFLAEAQKDGTTYTQKTVGGKDVYVDDSGSTDQYAYFKGDAVIFASAKTEAQAATILQQLP